MKDLLLAHLVRQNQNEPIAFPSGDERERETRIACRRLDESPAGLDLSAVLGGFDHGEADAVLDGAAGGLTLELEPELARTGVDAQDADDRRVPDEREDAARRLLWMLRRSHVRAAFRPDSRSDQRSSTCSRPTDKRTKPSPIPSARRTSTGNEACVMSAGCSARDSTPPKL